jgi:hypothetical protein
LGVVEANVVAGRVADAEDFAWILPVADAQVGADAGRLGLAGAGFDDRQADVGEVGVGDAVDLRRVRGDVGEEAGGAALSCRLISQRSRL